MHPRPAVHALCCALLAFALFAPAARAFGQENDAVKTRTQTFETVWKIVNDKFFDPKFNGVDWKAVHERYAPRVAALKSDGEMYVLLNDMLGELHVSHFALLPPESDDESSVDASDDSWGGDAGFAIRIVEEKPIVTWVVEGSPAEKVGLRTGYVVTKVGPVDAAHFFSQFKGVGLTPSLQRLRARRVLQSALQGMPGSTVDVSFLDEAGKEHAVKVARIDREGYPIKFADLPTVLAIVESRELENGVGYVRFNIFLPPIMDDIKRAIRSFRNAPAIIVDLRGNPGGIGGMAPALASMFLPKEQPLGTMKFRKGEMRFLAFKNPDPYTGLLVVLTDEGSASTSEIFAGALQELGRAVVIGETTAGAVLPSVIERLPNGARLQYAVADFRTPKGVLLEGRGVVPDVPVDARQKDYLAGGDPTLKAATKYVQTKLATAPVAHTVRDSRMSARPAQAHPRHRNQTTP